jgi:hypothetical protein
MLDAEEENWRDREESLEFAVLGIVTVEWGSSFNLCMKRRKKN